MRVLVTGATGFVGSHSTAAIVGAGHDVRLLARDADKAARVLSRLGVDVPGERVDVAIGDVTDERAVEAAVDGCDAAVHTAALVAMDRKRADEAYAVNVGGTQAVLGAAVAAGLDPVVYVSSVSALFVPGGPTLTPDSPVAPANVGYAKSKSDAETYARSLQADGAPVTITYPGGVWGPYDPSMTDGVASVVLFMKAGVLPGTSGGFPAVDVRDVADVHARVLEPGRGPRRYLVGGRLLPLRELADILRSLTGRRFPLPPAPVAVMRGMGLVGDALARIGINQPITHEGMVTLTTGVRCDSSATERDLGVTFRPTRDTVADMLRWLHADGHLTAKQVGPLAPSPSSPS
ncbi:MAG: NAD-dependent epimerase/dehydratase [Acidimicrobiales bacterium]|nr:NAD-dependent epimerase/dehydratase [Acidimicrobiales bacterium]